MPHETLDGPTSGESDRAFRTIASAPFDLAGAVLPHLKGAGVRDAGPRRGELRFRRDGGGGGREAADLEQVPAESPPPATARNPSRLRAVAGGGLTLQS